MSELPPCPASSASARARSARSTRSDDDHLLLVASDRISAFDVVLPTPIPDKGKVLTAMTDFWLDHLAGRRRRPPDHAPTSRSSPRRCSRTPTRCAAAACCAGAPRSCRWSAWRAATSPGRAGRSTAPTGPSAASRCRPAWRSRRSCPSRSSRRRRRRSWASTTRTSASSRWRTIVGADLAERLRDITLRAVRDAPPSTRGRKGIILADTKFEFGLVDGELTLIDEVLTPDSSRFWPADDYAGRTRAGVVRQAVRARLARDAGLGQDRARARSCPPTSWRAPGSATLMPTSGCRAVPSTSGVG